MKPVPDTHPNGVKPVPDAHPNGVKPVPDTHPNRVNRPTQDKYLSGPRSRTRTCSNTALPFSSDVLEIQPLSSCITDGYLSLSVGKVTVVKESGKIFASCVEVFRLTDITHHVKKNGFKLIDNCLSKAELNKDCFIFQGIHRSSIWLNALLVVLKSRIGGKSPALNK